MSEFRRYRVASKLLESFGISSSPQQYLERLGQLAKTCEEDGHTSSSASGALCDPSGRSELLLSRLAQLNPQLANAIRTLCQAMGAAGLDPSEVPHRQISASLPDRKTVLPTLQEIQPIEIKDINPESTLGSQPPKTTSRREASTALPGSYIQLCSPSVQRSGADDANEEAPTLKIRALDNSFEAQASRYPHPMQELFVIEDLLLLLLGLPGRYMYRDGTDSRLFYVDQTISQSIMEAILPIMEICFCSQAVSQFCRASWVRSAGRVHQAFASSALKAIKELEQVIVLLEKKFAQGSLGLQQLCFHMQPFRRPMFALYRLVDGIERRQLRGGAIVIELEKSLVTYSGDRALRSLLEPLLADSYQPVLQMAERWLSAGELEDDLEEFFISQREALKDAASDGSPAAQLFFSFQVVPNLVPSVLAGLADKILLIGKYQRILGEGFSLPVQLSPSQDSRRLAALIDERLALVDQQILLRINAEQRLLKALSSCKQLYMAGNSDLVQTFLDSAAQELEKPPTAVVLDSLQTAWDHSVATVLRANPEAKVFSIYVATRSLSQQLQLIDSHQEGLEHEPELPPKALDYFSIQSAHSFPDTLVFNHDCMQKYELLFRFNFCLASLHRELSIKTADTGCPKPLAKRYLLLRRQLLHFVQNLRQYLAYEVLEPNWDRFMEALGKAKGLDAIASCHAQLLDSCLRQATLTNVKLIKRLYALFGHCRQFLALEMAAGGLLETKLAAIQGAFTKSLRGFLEALQYFSSRDYDYHLGTLFSRMDYNSYYYAASYGDPAVA